jgi:predicted AAA+ superfamily ATPase
MIELSEEDFQARLAFDNPWWDEAAALEYPVLAPTRHMPQRAYFSPFRALAEERGVRRAIILMGPRRVGKTILMHQCIERWLRDGVAGRHLMFLSLETPIYTNIPLERFLRIFVERFGHTPSTPLTILIDEIQYLPDWERHLTSLVNSYPGYRFIASGSAAAALKLKSRESGAGRFTEFLLPPLSFAEYLHFIGQDSLVEPAGHGDGRHFRCEDIATLNQHFLAYLNAGGYPEAVFNDAVRRESDRFIKNDIIDKVLLRDLPQLYGIRDIQELNRLFNVLAYNTGNELSPESLSQSSGVSKTTLAKYLEYLEAAFLIKRIDRIDQNARRFQRATAFKVYLTNPSMRAALFGGLAEDDQSMGALAETALFSQWFHHSPAAAQIHYARWARGEIDMVHLDPRTQQPSWCAEIKWSDRPLRDPQALRHLLAFWKQHPGVRSCTITTKTVQTEQTHAGRTLRFVPTSLQAYAAGRHAVGPEVPEASGSVREEPPRRWELRLD